MLPHTGTVANGDWVSGAVAHVGGRRWRVVDPVPGGTALGARPGVAAPNIIAPA
jgi:hypothetical protein